MLNCGIGFSETNPFELLNGSIESRCTYIAILPSPSCYPSENDSELASASNVLPVTRLVQSGSRFPKSYEPDTSLTNSCHPPLAISNSVLHAPSRVKGKSNLLRRKRDFGVFGEIEDIVLYPFGRFSALITDPELAIQHQLHRITPDLVARIGQQIMCVGYSRVGSSIGRRCPRAALLGAHVQMRVK